MKPKFEAKCPTCGEDYVMSEYKSGNMVVCVVLDCSNDCSWAYSPAGVQEWKMAERRILLGDSR